MYIRNDLGKTVKYLPRKKKENPFFYHNIEYTSSVLETHEGSALISQASTHECVCACTVTKAFRRCPELSSSSLHFLSFGVSLVLKFATLL